jgi:hypothetical protein
MNSSIETVYAITCLPSSISPPALTSTTLTRIALQYSLTASVSALLVLLTLLLTALLPLTSSVNTPLCECARLRSGVLLILGGGERRWPAVGPAVGPFDRCAAVEADALRTRKFGENSSDDAAAVVDVAAGAMNLITRVGPSGCGRSK